MPVLPGHPPRLGEQVALTIDVRLSRARAIIATDMATQGWKSDSRDPRPARFRAPAKIVIGGDQPAKTAELAEQALAQDEGASQTTTRKMHPPARSARIQGVLATAR